MVIYKSFDLNRAWHCPSGRLWTFLLSNSVDHCHTWLDLLTVGIIQECVLVERCITISEDSWQVSDNEHSADGLSVAGGHSCSRNHFGSWRSFATRSIFICLLSSTLYSEHTTTVDVYTPEPWCPSSRTGVWSSHWIFLGNGWDRRWVFSGSGVQWRW